MTIDRRSLLQAGGAAVAGPLTLAAFAGPAEAAQTLAEFGLEPNAERDQAAALQKALDALAARGQPLILPGGVYLTGPLKLPASSAIIGTPGLTVLRARTSDSVLAGEGLKAVHLAGLGFERSGGARSAAVAVSGATVSIAQCSFTGAGLALALERCSGAVDAIEITGASEGISASDAVRLAVSRCRVMQCQGAGISVSGLESEDSGFTIAHNQLGRCGIGIAADGAGLVTGNQVSGAASFGLRLGRAKGQGHLMAQGNLLRNCRIGIALSSSGDDILVSLNRITGAKDGAIRAFDGDKLVGPDLTRQSAEAYLNLTVAGNVAR
jgi:hypothetical protein